MKETGIELSTASDSGFVIPLTKSNYQIELLDGDRPDTSKSSFLAKSPIPSDVSDGEALVVKLKRFVATLELIGRLAMPKYYPDFHSLLMVFDPLCRGCMLEACGLPET